MFFASETNDFFDKEYKIDTMYVYINNSKKVAYSYTGIEPYIGIIKNVLSNHIKANYRIRFAGHSYGGYIALRAAEMIDCFRVDLIDGVPKTLSNHTAK